jgi:hypothetical protein
MGAALASVLKESPQARTMIGNARTLPLKVQLFFSFFGAEHASF